MIAPLRSLRKHLRAGGRSLPGTWCLLKATQFCFRAPATGAESRLLSSMLAPA